MVESRFLGVECLLYIMVKGRIHSMEYGGNNTII